MYYLIGNLVICSMYKNYKDCKINFSQLETRIIKTILRKNVNNIIIVYRTIGKIVEANVFFIFQSFRSVLRL